MRRKNPNKSGSNIQSCILWIIFYLLFLFALFFYFKVPIRENLSQREYIESLNEYKRMILEGEVAEFNIALYSIEGLESTEKEGRLGFTDLDHLKLEALLDGPDERALSKGLITYINPRTRLIGLSIENDVAYVVLSPAFLASADMEKAKAQIEETLRADNPDLRVAIIVDDEII